MEVTSPDGLGGRRGISPTIYHSARPRVYKSSPSIGERRRPGSFVRFDLRTHSRQDSVPLSSGRGNQGSLIEPDPRIHWKIGSPRLNLYSVDFRYQHRLDGVQRSICQNCPGCSYQLLLPESTARCEPWRLERLVIKLLPLWGNIGPTLQKQLFLSRRMKQNTTKFALDPTSKSLPPVLNIPASSLPAVLAAPRLSPQDYQTISTTAKLSGDLNLSDLSVFYRLSVLPRILEITPSQYNLLSTLFPEQSNPLLNPPATLAFLQWWNTFNNAGWTLQQLLYVLKISPSPDRTDSPSGDIILQATASLVPGIKDIDNNYSEYTVTPFPRDKATANLVQKISTVMFDAATVTLISQFLEGKLSSTCLVTSCCLSFYPNPRRCISKITKTFTDQERRFAPSIGNSLISKDIARHFDPTRARWEGCLSGL